MDAEIETENEGSEFRRWASIERLEQMVSITEKIHGSNAQILVTETEVRAGSRERWLDSDRRSQWLVRWQWSGLFVRLPPEIMIV